jgi:hypothetical protein
VIVKKVFRIIAFFFPEDNPMFSKSMNIADFDPDLWNAMQDEEKRQEDHIELIASENYTSPRVMQAQGSVLTNKYAEGYPSKRYYGGCEYVDVAESLALERIKKLFNADYANVQPHSGSQANAAVFFALLNAGDTILGMSLSDGGHLTHGAKVNFSGKLFNAVQYGLNAECRHRRGRLRPGRSAGERASAEDDHRRILGLFARHGLAAFPRYRRCGRRLPVRRHGARRRTGRRGTLPEPGRHRRRLHQHHA